MMVYILHESATDINGQRIFLSKFSFIFEEQKIHNFSFRSFLCLCLSLVLRLSNFCARKEDQIDDKKSNQVLISRVFFSLIFLLLPHVSISISLCPSDMRLAESVDTSSIGRTNSNNKNLLIAHVSNLGDPDKAPRVRHLSLKPSPSDPTNVDYCALPTAAESFFPWRRDRSYQSLGLGTLLFTLFDYLALSFLVSFFLAI
jgi:hypothetical protein